MEWRDGEVANAAVGWVLATVFVRFCEDNALIDGVWLAGPDERLQQAADSETAFYQAEPSRNSRDWLRDAFAALAALPAGRDLVDPEHHPAWRATISADSAAGLLAFWRRQEAAGALVHDFTDTALSTRFLGDLYQDLSESARKKYALLQTPVFVEEFILDQTLTPALAEFGLEGLRLIDPTCGSGHFLLGSFHRLLDQWQAHAPGLDRRERVQRALDSVHGVDLNPFAVAIARFRLTVAALRASGLTRLPEAPAFRFHLAVGDSLLAGFAGRQGDLLDASDAADSGAASFHYAAEDVGEHPGILDRGRYQVVVGNPPYITVKDPALNAAYRASYSTCKGRYALSVPFMELFFELAQRADANRAAGYVGQITSNSFMKREFGTRLIEDLLAGDDLSNPVDLTTVIDSEGAWIPGHNTDGTPTCILFGRRRHPVGQTVRAVLSKGRREGSEVGPGGQGPYWTSLVQNLDDPSFDNDYLTIADLERSTLAQHPWSLSGGGAGELMERLNSQRLRVADLILRTGMFGDSHAEDVFAGTLAAFRRLGVARSDVKPAIDGNTTRDFSCTLIGALVLCDGPVAQPIAGEGTRKSLWPWRTSLWSRAMFGGGTYREAGRDWLSWHQLSVQEQGLPRLTFAKIASHNHLVFLTESWVEKPGAIRVELHRGASTKEHMDLLGVLSSSVACFWLKQVSQPKGGAADIVWLRTYEFTGTNVQEFPLPSQLPGLRAGALDSLSKRLQDTLPAAVAAQWGISGGRLKDAHADFLRLRSVMVFVQEELDWETYGAYGLVDEDLTYGGDDVKGIALGERAFEIALSRQVAKGMEEPTWFERHCSTSITDMPLSWPSAYRDLVQRRLDLIASDPFIRLLERPEFKRRWASRSWEDMKRDALTDSVLDRLEEPGLWRDETGPRVLSVAQLADRVRGDEQVVEALRLLTGAIDVDVTMELGRLLSDEAAPFLAAYRYSDSGMPKRAEWEQVWSLQRREDAGDSVQIPVPPKYKNTDFQKPAYWSARGKLDVPKERFVLYPDASREGDRTAVLGWAGWDHLEQARALTSLIVARGQDDQWSADRLSPLLAGLAELEPWLHQWHDEPDPTFGGSPAVFFTRFVDGELGRIGRTRDDLAGWRPEAPTRGRRNAAAGSAPDPVSIEEPST